MNGNGPDSSQAPYRVIDIAPPAIAEWRPPRQRLWPALLLFLLTILSTLSVGAEFARSYALGQEPFTGTENIFTTLFGPLLHPRLLWLGVPFSFTLLGILLAHELGHYFACRFYGIDASYPYFLPAPTLFGTFGAFIKIRSPITTRKALFDVGFSGPLVGFLLAAPAMAWGVAHSKILPGVGHGAVIAFGTPPLMQLFVHWFRPGAMAGPLLTQIYNSWVHPNQTAAALLLHPVGRAAWVGFFATALNLLPSWQLDGGHVVYSVFGARQRRISLAVSLGLLLAGVYFWSGWIFWGVLLLVLSLRYPHPPLLDQWEPLPRSRRIWALVALAIFLLCLTPWPTTNP